MSTKADQAHIAALYDGSPGRAGTAKKPWLDRLKTDGVYLIDLVPYPVNKLASRERAKALRDHVPACVEAARTLNPAGVIVCHTPTFNALATPMRAAGLPVLHDTAIPFPLSPLRARFVAGVRAALARLPARSA